MTATEDSEFHSTVSALELANLAALLDPQECRSNPKAALQAAFDFYTLASLWVEQFPDAGIQQILSSTSPHVLDEALAIVGKHNLTLSENLRLRFYPKRSTDDVREFLGVKSARAVNERLRTWFIADARHHGRTEAQGSANYANFRERMKRTEKDGTVYIGIPRTLLEGVKSLQGQVKREGGFKAQQTSLQRRAARQSQMRDKQKRTSQRASARRKKSPSRKNFGST